MTHLDPAKEDAMRRQMLGALRGAAMRAELAKLDIEMIIAALEDGLTTVQGALMMVNADEAFRYLNFDKEHNP